jgi:hypothetical protein
MTDSPNIFGDAEPARDRALGARLGEVAGLPPMGDADWHALAVRISAARTGHRASWWSYAAHWERRAIPVAVAAGLAGVLALWGLGMPVAPRTASVAMVSDPVAAMVEGTPAADAAQSYARALTGNDDFSLAEAY